MIVSNENIAYNKKMKKISSPHEIIAKLRANLTLSKPISTLPDKKEFSNIEDIAFQAVDLTNLSKYKEVPLNTERKLIFFTWVIPSGLGDLSMQIHIAEMIHRKAPHLSIELISLVDERSPIPGGLKSNLPHHIIRYKHPTPPTFSNEIQTLLREAFSIIEIPTAYFDFKSLKSTIEEDNPHPPVISRIGQYGFIDTPDYNPSTRERSMGLYFLEKGVITLDRVPPKTRDPDTYFAYLITENGIITYILSILLSRKDSKDLTLLIPNLGKILPILEKINFKEYGIANIDIKDSEHNTSLTIQDTGKTLSISGLEEITPKEIINYMATCNKFVGIRGDGSFTECLSTDALFFYDALDHALPFLTDLAHIAKSKLLPYFSLCEYLPELMNTSALPEERAAKIAGLLDDPALFVGLEKLRTILYEEYSFNDGLFHLVKQNLTYYNTPTLH